MQTYELTLTSLPSNSFRCQKAANSVDLDIEKKLTHHFKVEVDIETPYNVGLIVVASGSGKSTLARKMFGDIGQPLLDGSRPIIEQFPETMTYEDCVEALNGSGLSQVACWVRPALTLSNGQAARAEIALQLCSNREIILIDEFTSVVDRTIAKVMSQTVQKMARRQKKKIVLISCHYDILEWLNPDWVIDCNKQEYIERRSLRLGFERSDTLSFEIRECDKRSWRYFSKYHYLSENLPGGFIKTFGLYHGGDQIGFQCFAEYVSWKDKSKRRVMHSNRTVIHPDYVGLGLGIKLINLTSELMSKEYRVMAKFSSLPVYKAMMKQPEWLLLDSKMDTSGGYLNTATANRRKKVKWWSFEFIGKKD